MTKSLTLTLLLAFAVVLILSGSYYVTDVRQEGEIERLQESRRAAALLNSRVEELLSEQSESSTLARDALTRWNARYKYIPVELTTADMLEYLESLSRRGFEQFDLDLVGQETTPDFSVYTFAIRGLTSYPALYDLVWHLENNREFYRIYDLKIDHATVTKGQAGSERQIDMVTFECTLDAYFAGIEGISTSVDSLKPIPMGLITSHRPAMDLFGPLVRPPAAPTGGAGAGDGPRNVLRLPEMESAKLVAMIGPEAIFETAQGRFALSEGDSVFEGFVESVDPMASVVRVLLNKESGTERLYFRVGREGPQTQPVQRAAPTPRTPQPESSD